MRPALILLWFSLPLWAAVPANITACFASLAFLSDGDAPTAVIDSTYLRLLDTAGSKLTPEVLKRIVETREPFTVAEGGTDLVALGRHLKAFGEMLGKKEWNTPEVRASLVAAVQRRLAGQSEATPERDRALARQRPTRTIPLLKSGLMQATSPDGKWLLLAHVGSSRRSLFEDWESTAHNLETGEVKRQKGKHGGHGEHVFSADGKTVYFARDGYRLEAVPFKDGWLDWDASRLIGTKHEDVLSHLETLRVSDDGRYLYGTNNMHSRKLVRVDVQTGEQLYLPIGSLMENHEQIDSLGVRAGTGELVLVFNSDNEKHRRVQLLAVEKKDGQETLVAKESVETDKDYNPWTKFTPAWSDGRVEWLRKEGVYRRDAKSQPAKVMPRPRYKLPSTGHEVDAREVFVRPGGNEIVVHYAERLGAEPRAWIDIWDVAQQKSVGGGELPDGTGNVFLSRDGGSVITSQPFRNKLEVIPLERYLSEGP